MTIPARKLGRGLEVSAQGLGCMGMSQVYGPADETESLATIDRALELGVTFLDTADVYGLGHNEELVGRAIAGRRDEVVLATKFGIVRRADDKTFRGINGRPEYVRSACDASLDRLGVDHTLDPAHVGHGAARHCGGPDRGPVGSGYVGDGGVMS